LWNLLRNAAKNVASGWTGAQQVKINGKKEDIAVKIAVQGIVKKGKSTSTTIPR
jgi:hypothetical protein